MTRKNLVTDEQLGQLARRQHDLFRRVREGTLPIDRVLDAFQQLIESPRDAFLVTVDRSISLAVMIEAGQYNRISPDITAEHFPIESSSTDVVKIELVHFGNGIRTNTVFEELRARDLRPATIEELLALGANPKTRDLQRQFPITALGSVWCNGYGGRAVPSLHGGASWRNLAVDWIELSWMMSEWDDNRHFAAVRKAA